MSFADLERGGDSITIILVIDGLPDVFFSGPTAPTVSGRTARPGVQRMTPVRCQLDGALLQASECTVSLTPDGEDHVSQLLRISPDGATRFLTLAATLPRSTATGGTLTVNESNAAWPSSGHLWIGRECIAYSAKPTTTTFTISGRGAYDSEIQRHVADLAQGRAPRLYSECCTWKGRRARVYIQARDLAGNLRGSPLCEVDGVIEGLPHALGQSGDVDVLVRSWAGRLDRTFGGEEVATGLQPNWHLFDGQVGHSLEHLTQGWPAAMAWATEVRSNFLVTDTVIDVDSTDGYQQRFDPAKVDDQRSGLVQFVAAATNWPRPQTYRVTAVGAGPTITIDPPVDFGGVAGDRVITAECAFNLGGASVLTTPGTAEAMPWPATALRRLAPQIGSRDITDSPDGLWAALAVQSDGDGQALRVTRNDEPIGLGSERPYVYLAVDLERVQGGPGLPGLCFGTDLPAHVAAAGEATPRWQAPGWRFEAGPRQPEGVEIDAGANRLKILRARNDGTPTAAKIPLRVPLAYWAVGERYLLTTDNPVGSPSAAAPAPVLAETTWGGQRVRRLLRIISAAQASTITAGAPGWALEVHPADRVTGYPLTDTATDERTTIRPVLAAEDVSPTAFMLQLLLSGDGDGFNHPAYDVLPFGADLPESAVDVRSFEAFPLPTELLGRRSLLLEDEENLTDLLRALATSVAGVITERVCREAGPTFGRRRLALVPMQVPLQSNAVGTFVAGDVLEGQSPNSETDEAVVNRLVIKARARDRASLSQVKGEIRINDQDSIAEHGAAPVEELDAVGVRFTSQSPQQHRALMETWAQKRFYLYGHPRRVVAAGVSHGLVATLSPGDVLVVGPAVVRAASGIAATNLGLLTVTEVTRDALMGTGEVRGIYRGALNRAAGWAPCMQVASIDSPTQVTVQANAYSEPTHQVLGTPQTDSSFFGPGDEVRCFERTSANPWPGTACTIASVVGNVVTFTAPHNFLAPGGRIRPLVFANQASAMELYGYLDASPVQVYA